AERGERVLALSPDPAAADRLVEALAAERVARIVRALADDENPQRPIAGVAQFTSRSQGIGRAEQLRREAALGISALEAKLSRFDRTRTVRTRLEEIERQRRALQAERDGLADSKQVEAGIAAELEAIRLRRDAALAPLAAERGVLAAKRAEKEAAVQAACAQAAQSKQPGFLARLFGAKPTATPDSTLVGDLEREAQSLAKRENELQAEVEAVSRPFTSEMERAIAAAVDTRRAVLDKSLAELEPEASRLEQTLREFLPRTAADDTVESGTLAANRGDLERELAIARTRQEELAHAGPDLARRFLAETQIVVGTPGSLTTDPVFKAFGETPAFGFLILDHAEELTEADFEPLMALASRWVLAGDAAMPEEPRPHLNGHSHGPRRSHQPTLLARLARRLDAEPWTIENDRLVFRLVDLSPDERKALTREPVLDHPHVELRVAAGAGDPVLAEIAFPAATAVVQAKSFLVSQLGEVLLRPCGECVWRTSGESLIAAWPLLESDGGEWVELEAGVRELIHGCGSAAFTAAVAFDRSTGWTDEQAAAWLQDHLPALSNSRLAVISRLAGSRCFV